MTISFVGPSAYTVNAVTVRKSQHHIDSVVTVPSVANATPFVSDTLVAELWLLPRPYKGSTASGYELGVDTLTSGLGVGAVLGAQTVDLSANQDLIPSGTYHVALLLVDKSAGPRVVDDWVNYAGQATLKTGPVINDESNGGGDDSDTGSSGNDNSNQSSSGNDHDNYSSGGGATTIVALSGPDTVTGDTSGDWVLLANSNVLFNSNGADTIFGSTASSTIDAAASPLYFGGSGAALFEAQGAAATLVGGGAETVMAGAADVLAFGGAGPLTFFAGTGASTVIGGSGGATVTGGAAGLLYFGSGPTDYVGGTGVDTVVGGSGALTATGGANGTLIFTGTSGGGVVGTGAGAATVVGFGVGDSLSATGSAAEVIDAAAGSETIDGTQSGGPDVFFAFGDGDVAEAGSGLVAIASLNGTQTLVGGGGSTLFQIGESGVARAITVENFAPARDFVSLAYYPAGTATTALAGSLATGGNEVLTLADGATVTFVGITNLAASSFV